MSLCYENVGLGPLVQAVEPSSCYELSHSVLTSWVPRAMVDAFESWCGTAIERVSLFRPPHPPRVLAFPFGWSSALLSMALSLLCVLRDCWQVLRLLTSQ